uniref:Alpha-2-macroglobulin bait region domain-containing protein n=1 Tax=Knipowitschia caucasica TaxID=637954 RepID=A0AAV2J3R1_KNICA
MDVVDTVLLVDITASYFFGESVIGTAYVVYGVKKDKQIKRAPKVKKVTMFEEGGTFNITMREIQEACAVQTDRGTTQDCSVHSLVDSYVYIKVSVLTQSDSQLQTLICRLSCRLSASDSHLQTLIRLSSDSHLQTLFRLSASDSHLQTQLQTLICRLSSDSQLQTLICRLSFRLSSADSAADSQLQTLSCRLSSDSQLQTLFRLSASDSQLQTLSFRLSASASQLKTLFRLSASDSQLQTLSFTLSFRLSASDSQLQTLSFTLSFRLSAADSLQTLSFRLSSADSASDSQLQTLSFRLSAADSQLQTLSCRLSSDSLQTLSFRLSSADSASDSQLQTLIRLSSDSQLQTLSCRLSSDSCYTFQGKGGDLVEIERSNIKIVNSPFVLKVKNMQQYLKPSLPFHVTILVNYHEGTPAQNVPLTVEMKSMPTLKVTGNTHVSINMPPEIKAQTFIPYTPASKVTPNYLYTRVVGNVQLGAMTLDLSVTSERTSSVREITYLVLSKGKLLDAKRVSVDQQQVTSVRIDVTSEMIPTFRFVAFYILDGEVVSDSIKLEVPNTCFQPPSVSTAQRTDFSPGKIVKLKVQGEPSAHVSLVAVDQAVYKLSKRRFNQRHILDEVDSRDMGCTHGSGANAMGVFSDAGLLFATNDGPSTDARQCN